jgi:pyruvate/2-oxoglutarate dehydrogenase complex dihydrolipoamide dehydrogenase (E3) component
MVERIETDICVIGAGSGGLTVAAGAVQMGARVVLIEKHKMGGDCLNTGCVPSKALLAAAHSAQTMRDSARFGVKGQVPEIDFQAVHDHIHGVIAAIAPNDSVERFEGLGVRVIKEAARFTGSDQMVAGDFTVRAKRFVVATGSSPAAPPIDGLGEVAYLTNETIFDLTERPEHLIVIGGGPIGVELAQAHRRLGTRVTLLEAFTILANDDPEAADVVRRRLVADGLDLREGAKIQRISPNGEGVQVQLEGEEPLLGSHLLVAAGRRANVEGLDLEAAGVTYTAKGIQVDDRLRSSNKKIYAVGDVAGGLQFTHVAGYHAGLVLRNVLFRLPAKVKGHAVPWVTYADPELAQVGLTEAAAREAHGASLRVLTFPYEDNDRALAERASEGFIKVMVGKRGRVLGATIVGQSAGELILPWVMAIDRGFKIGALASLIAPYPTFGEISKRVAGSYYTKSLFSERTRMIVRFLLRFG